MHNQSNILEFVSHVFSAFHEEDLVALYFDKSSYVPAIEMLISRLRKSQKIHYEGS